MESTCLLLVRNVKNMKENRIVRNKNRLPSCAMSTCFYEQCLVETCFSGVVRPSFSLPDGTLVDKYSFLIKPALLLLHCQGQAI